MRGRKCEACGAFIKENEDRIELTITNRRKINDLIIGTDICMECATNGVQFVLENKWTKKLWHSKKMKKE